MNLDRICIFVGHPVPSGRSICPAIVQYTDRLARNRGPSLGAKVEFFSSCIHHQVSKVDFLEYRSPTRCPVYELLFLAVWSIFQYHIWINTFIIILFIIHNRFHHCLLFSVQIWSCTSYNFLSFELCSWGFFCLSELAKLRREY